MAIGGGSAMLGSAVGEIRLTTDRAEANVKRLQGTINQFGQSAGSSFDRVATGLGLLGAARGLGNLFAGAVGSAADFEQAMSNVGAVANATGSELDALREKALQIGKETSFSAQEGAAGLEELLKAGLSVEEVLGGAADGAVALAAAAGIAIPAAAGLIGTASNQYGIAADEAVRIADLYAAAAATSAVSAESIGEAQNYVGTTAKQLGISIEQSTAAIAALGDAGREGSAAGTALNSALTSLAAPTDVAATAMAELGITAYDAVTGEFKELPVLLGEIATATSGMSDEVRNAALDDIFDVNGLAAVNILLETQTEEATAAGKGWQDYYTAVTQSGAAAEQAEARLDNFSGSMEALRGSVETAAIMVGTIFLPALREVVDAATLAVNAFIGLPEPLLAIAGAGVGAGAAVLGIAGALTLAGPKLGEFAAHLGGVSKALRGLLLANPYVLALAAAVGLFALAYRTNFGGIADLTNSVVSTVVDRLGAFADAIGSAFASAEKLRGIGNVGAVFVALGVAIDKAFGVDVSGLFYAAAKGAGNLGEGVGRVARQFTRLSRIIKRDGLAVGLDRLFGDIGKKMLSGIGDAVSAMPRAFGTLLAGIETGFRPLDSILANTGKAIYALGSALEAAFDGDFGFAFDLAGNAFERLRTALDIGVSTAIGGAIGLGRVAVSVGSWLVETASDLGQAVYAKIQELWPGVQSFLGEAWAATIGIGTWLVTTTANLGAAVYSRVLELWPVVKATLGSSWSAAIGIGSWLITATANLGTAVLQRVQELWPTVKSALGSAWSAAVSIGTWLVSTTANLGAAVKTRVDELWPSVKSALSDGYDALVNIANLVIGEISAIGAGAAGKIQRYLSENPTSGIQAYLDVSSFNTTFSAAALGDWKLAVKEFLEAEPITVKPEVKVELTEAVANAVRGDGGSGGGGGGGGGMGNPFFRAGMVLGDKFGLLFRDGLEIAFTGVMNGLFLDEEVSHQQMIEGQVGKTAAWFDLNKMGDAILGGLTPGALAGAIGPKLQAISDAAFETLQGWADGLTSMLGGIFGGGDGYNGGGTFDPNAVGGGAGLFDVIIEALTPDLNIPKPTLPSWVRTPNWLTGPLGFLTDQINLAIGPLEKAWETYQKIKGWFDDEEGTPKENQPETDWSVGGRRPGGPGLVPGGTDTSAARDGGMAAGAAYGLGVGVGIESAADEVTRRSRNVFAGSKLGADADGQTTGALHAAGIAAGITANQGAIKAAASAALALAGGDGPAAPPKAGGPPKASAAPAPPPPIVFPAPNLTQYAAGLVTAATTLQATLGVLGTLAQGLAATLGSAASHAVSTFNSGLVEGFVLAAQITATAMDGIAAAAKIGSLYQPGYDAGVSAGQGLVDGLNSMNGAAQQAGQALAGAADLGLKGGLQIGSPSKLFRGRGENAVSSFLMPFRDRAGEVRQVLGSLVGSLPSQSVSTAQMLGSQPSQAAHGGGGGAVVHQYLVALRSDEMVALLRQAEQGAGAAVYVGGLHDAFAGVMG